MGILAAAVASTVAQARRPLKPVPPVMPLAPLELAWSVDLPLPPSAGGAMDAARIYLPLEGENLVALDRDTGATRWRRDVESAWPPALGGGKVVIAASDEIHVLDADTGNGVWRSEVPGPVLAPLLVTPSRVVALAAPNELIGFALDTGEVVWRRALEGTIDAPGLTADLHTGYVTNRAHIQAFALEDGAVRWERDLPGQLHSPAVGRDRVLVGSSENALYALDARTGGTAWTFRTGGDVRGVAVDGDTVFLASFDNLLRAVNRSNGNQRWKRALATRPSSPPQPFVGLVAQPGQRPALSTFAAADGAVIGTYDPPADLIAPLLIDPSPRARRMGVAAITKDGQVFGLRSVDLMLRETASTPLAALPGRPVAREILPTPPAAR